MNETTTTTTTTTTNNNTLQVLKNLWHRMAATVKARSRSAFEFPVLIRSNTKTAFAAHIESPKTSSQALSLCLDSPAEAARTTWEEKRQFRQIRANTTTRNKFSRPPSAFPRIQDSRTAKEEKNFFWPL
jgi:hypothetical protein